MFVDVAIAAVDVIRLPRAQQLGGLVAAAPPGKCLRHVGFAGRQARGIHAAGLGDDRFGDERGRRCAGCHARELRARGEGDLGPVRKADRNGGSPCMAHPRSLAAAVVVCCAFACVTPGSAQRPREQPVMTLAGTGAAGMRDGPARSATFMMPTGIARARDGTLYIADTAAQRIRTLAHGIVRTVAGSGTVVPPGLSVAGGYRDGPALHASFDRPTGL